MPSLPGWTKPLHDDGWTGNNQRFPTARQIVVWTDCPECGAERGMYCTAGRVAKKTGELLDLADWLELNGGSAPAPSCPKRRQRARKELNKRIKAEERRQQEMHRAMTKVGAARTARSMGLEIPFTDALLDFAESLPDSH